MVDWHSHVLPAMDDGSRSVEESLEMLALQKLQGADTVVATPHFYADEEPIEDFLGRRERAYEKLNSSTGNNSPRVICGAEVKFYSGIGRMAGLETLTVQGTKLLLLEMPFAKWTAYTVKELEELAATRGVKVMLAHIERYLPFRNEDAIRRLSAQGIMMQVNASFFERLGSRLKALRLLSGGLVQFIGSDCHNMTTRRPDIGGAYQIIQKKFGEEFVADMNEFGRRFFDK